MVRRLRFFPDYGADPVWDRDSGSMVNLDSLEIPQATRDSLRSWRVRWEDLAWQAMAADDFQNGMSSARGARA